MRLDNHKLTRRHLLGAMIAAGGLFVIGCGQSSRKSPAGTQETQFPPTGGAQQAASMTVYRDPGCGCCEAWAELARQAGYHVAVVDDSDMPTIKRKYGVPDELVSCHTAVVSGYVVEGHVPFDALRKLLAERLSGVKGIAVAGMPRGSPGMEMPDGTTDPIQVMAFDSRGQVRRYGS